jgi:hypothetical protein
MFHSCAGTACSGEIYVIAIRDVMPSTAEFDSQLRPSLLSPARLVIDLHNGPTRNVLVALLGLERHSCPC